MTEASLPTPPPSPPLPETWYGWWRVFGPGAIIASLTIGTGEIIFASRGGVLFGYRILFVFLLVCLLKWALMFAMARQMVLSGVHPFQRWRDLPGGPSGWLPMTFLALAVVCIPIWVSFHAGVLGNYLAGLTGTRTQLAGIWEFVWALAFLGAVLTLALRGGYATAERVQLGVVLAMLVCAVASLLLYGPDWWDILKGFFTPPRLEYPEWVRSADEDTANMPVWVELTRYVGVVGGGGYDYLAYAAFLREKRWGNAAAPLPDGDLQEIADRLDYPARRWLRAPLWDAICSFLIVLAVSVVFVAAGHLLLAPLRQLPKPEGFLDHQAAVLTRLHPSLLPLYIAGVCLTMWGTLYGTLEVAPTILRETVLVFHSRLERHQELRLRRVALIWCGGVGATVLLLQSGDRLLFQDSRFPDLLSLLTVANVFTGVMACGIIAALNLWADRTFFPSPLRMNGWLILLNVAAALLLTGLGILGLKAYADQADQYGWAALPVFVGTCALGGLGAKILGSRIR